MMKVPTQAQFANCPLHLLQQLAANPTRDPKVQEMAKWELRARQVGK